MSKARIAAFAVRGIARLGGASSLTLAQNAIGAITFGAPTINTLNLTQNTSNIRLPAGKYRFTYMVGCFSGGGTNTIGDGLNASIYVNGASVSFSRVNFYGANVGIAFQAVVDDVITVTDTDDVSFRVATSHAQGLSLITTADWTRVLIVPVA